MSIHEITYGPRGSILNHRCIDEEISNAGETTRYPFIGQSSVMKTLFEPDDIKRVITTVVKATAMSTDSIKIDEFVQGFTEDNGFHKMFTSKRTLSGNAINEANIQIGNKGYAYSETEIYVAPKRHRLPVISKIVHPNAHA